MFEQRQFARVRTLRAARASTSASSSSCRSAARRRRAPIISALAVVRRRAARRTASTSAPGCAGRASTSSCKVDEWHQSSAAAAGSAASADRLRAGSRAASAPGLAGERRAVLEGVAARRRHRALARPEDELPALGALPPARGARPERRAARGAACSASRGCSGLPRRGRARRRARGDRRLRARGRAAAVGDPGGGLRERRLGRVARRPRERDPWHVLLLAAIVLLAWNPYTLFDAGLPALVRGGASRSSSPSGRSLRVLEGYPVPPRLARGASRSRRRAASRPRRSSGCSSARCRCSACVANALVEPAVGAAARARVRGRCRRSRRAAARRARSPGLNGWIAAYIAACARLVVGCPVRAGDRAGAPRWLRRGAARGRRLCLAAMADELKPAYLIARRRPAEGRPRGRAAARPLRAGRGRAARRRRRRPATTRSPPATRWASSAAGTRLVVVESVEGWKAPDAKAVADVPEVARARHDARARRRRAEEGRAAREGGRRGKGDVLLWDVAHEGGAPLDRRAVQAARRRRPSPTRAGCSPSSSATTSTSSRARSTSSRPGRTASEVTEADVEALVAPRAESPPWNLTDAWGARDVGGVLRAAERMLDRTGDPLSQHDPAARRQPDQHVRDARVAQRLEEQGVTPKDAAAALGDASRSRRRSSTRRCGTSAREELDDALVRLAELDHALKGGSRLANELELERALVEITAPR